MGVRRVVCGIVDAKHQKRARNVAREKGSTDGGGRLRCQSEPQLGRINLCELSPRWDDG